MDVLIWLTGRADPDQVYLVINIVGRITATGQTFTVAASLPMVWGETNAARKARALPIAQQAVLDATGQAVPSGARLEILGIG